MDGWTSPLGKSIYNFVIQTPTKKEYLWKLNDYSLESHTGNFLAEQIDQIIQQIGNKRFNAIVTDGASNVRLAREIITTKYPHILNIRCIAHSINLLTKDITDSKIKFPWGYNILKNCQKIVTFFEKSHQSNALLHEGIKNLNILGGGLKSGCKTRWSTYYDCTSSILRLESCFNWVTYKFFFIFVNYNHWLY